MKHKQMAAGNMQGGKKGNKNNQKKVEKADRKLIERVDKCEGGEKHKQWDDGGE